VTESGGPTDQDRRQAIEAELRRLEESATYSAQSQFEQAKRWRGVNLGLGIPASLLAAIAGGTALAVPGWEVIAGVTALVAAAFGGVLTTVNAAHRMNQASSAANAYLEIQTAARQARLVDLPYVAIDDARNTLAEITARRDEQNKTAEPPSKKSYRKGQKNIRTGGQSYAVDGSPESPPPGGHR
jgi:hypothetical protein